MSNQQVYVTTAGSTSLNPLGSLYSFPIEIHRFGPTKEFHTISQIESMEIVSELVLDALKSDAWEERRVYITHRYPEATMLRALVGTYNEFADAYFRDGLMVVVKDDVIRFSGKRAAFIDNTADIMTDEDLLVKFLDWLYEGGDCPIMRGTINRLVKRFNTYPTSNDHLNRKNNRKK